jgi:hypothetical protein
MKSRYWSLFFLPGLLLVVFLGPRLSGAAQLIANVIGLPLFITGLILAARSVFVDKDEPLRASMGIVGRSRRPMYLVRKFLLRVRYSRLVAYW